MSKPFLLIAGSYYGTICGFNFGVMSSFSDWLDRFATAEQAEAQIKEECGNYQINGRTYYWYEIVNINEWPKKRG